MTDHKPVSVMLSSVKILVTIYPFEKLKFDSFSRFWRTHTIMLINFSM